MGVVFDDDNAWMEVLYRLPYPVVVAVDVNREEIEVFRDSIFPEEIFDILRGDEFPMKIDGWVVIPTVHQQSCPSLVFQEVAHVALCSILDAEFHAELICRLNHCEDGFEDPVFAILREFPSFDEWDEALEGRNVVNRFSEPLIQGEEKFYCKEAP